MKKTLFLAAMLTTVAITAPAFAETLTLETDTNYTAVGEGITDIELNSHKLTFSGETTVVAPQNITGGGILEADAATVSFSGSTSRFSGNIAVTNGGSMTVAEMADTLPQVSVSGNGTIILGEAVTISHGADYAEVSAVTYGLQKWGGSGTTGILKLTGTDNSVKGAFLNGGDMKLVSASDTAAAVTLTDNLEYGTGAHLIAGQGVTLNLDLSTFKQNKVANVFGDGNNTKATGSAFTNLFTGNGAILTAGGGVLSLTGHMKYDQDDDTKRNVSQTFDAGIDLKVTGDMSLQTGSNYLGSAEDEAPKTVWNLGAHSLSVGGKLQLENRQYMTVGNGGSLTVGGQLYLGHNANSNDNQGKFRAGITVGERAALSVNNIYINGNKNTIDVNGGSITFTKSDGNVLGGYGTVDAGSITFTDATLLAAANGWEMKALGSMAFNISGTTLLRAAGKTVTLGSNNGNVDLQGTVKGNGTLNLEKVRLNGDVSFESGSANPQGDGDIIVSLKNSLSKKTDIAPVNLSLGAAVTVKLATASENVLNNLSVTTGSLEINAATSAGSMTLNSGKATINAQSSFGGVEMSGGTLNVNKNTSSGSLNTTGGQINVSNADLLVTNDEAAVKKLNLGTKASVTVQNDHSGTLALQNLTVTGSGTTVNADLDLSGATVTLGGHSVELGCDLKFDGTIITLSAEDIERINTEAGLLLFTGVDSLTLGSAVYREDYHNYAGAAGLTLSTTATLPETVYLNYSAADKTVTLSVVPEPATATLSLLALAALAARRRRK